MGTKAETTRARIVDAAVPIFNVKGYAGASLADVLEAAQIKKGGLYRHFESKEQLALAAFDRAASEVVVRYLDAMRRAAGPLERLRACVDTAAASLDSPPVPGGCPILNAAVESDDTFEALRVRAHGVMEMWHEAIREAVAAGIADGCIDRRTDASAVASVITSSLEGAIMMTLLYRSTRHMSAVAAHLHAFIDGIRA